MPPNSKDHFLHREIAYATYNQRLHPCHYEKNASHACTMYIADSLAPFSPVTLYLFLFLKLFFYFLHSFQQFFNIFPIMQLITYVKRANLITTVIGKLTLVHLKNR